MTPQEQFEHHFKAMYKICEEQGWGDPFSYAVSREILIANKLGHKKADTLSGADGYDQDGACEYKSTIGKNINGAYNGISVQSTWEKQVKYLKEEKIGKYKNHYAVRFDGAEIVECYTMTGDKVLELLLPKLKKNYESTLTKKDPRLGASLCMTEIHKHGVRLI